MTRYRGLVCSGAAWFALGLTGCSIMFPGPSKDGKNDGTSSGVPQASLRGTAVPASFTFATSRGVNLTLSANSALFGAKGVAGVEVKNADDALLYQGPIHSGESLSVHLVVPSKDDSVKVAFRTQGTEQHGTVSITNDAAAHTFQ